MAKFSVSAEDDGGRRIPKRQRVQSNPSVLEVQFEERPLEASLLDIEEDGDQRQEEENNHDDGVFNREEEEEEDVCGREDEDETVHETRNNLHHNGGCEEEEDVDDNDDDEGEEEEVQGNDDDNDVYNRVDDHDDVYNREYDDYPHDDFYVSEDEQDAYTRRWWMLQFNLELQLYKPGSAFKLRSK